jgi:hypothetical protein
MTAQAAVPRAVTGAVTDKSDAVTQRYFGKYQRMVDALKMETLAAQLLALRETAHNDILHLRRIESNHNKTFDQNTRTAARNNATWIKSRLMPYIARLEQFQRGR